MTQPPDVVFTAALAVADRAMQGVLGDRAAWAEETARTDAAALPWPLQIRGEGYPQLLRVLAAASVDTVLRTIHEADGHMIQPDPDNADFQIILRVVDRAVRAADVALCAAFGGPRGGHRLAGKREFINWIKTREVEAAVRNGGPRAEALGKLPMSRAAAYRAMKRR